MHKHQKTGHQGPSLRSDNTVREKRRKGKGRERKGRERKGREGKGRDRKGGRKDMTKSGQLLLYILETSIWKPWTPSQNKTSLFKFCQKR